MELLVVVTIIAILSVIGITIFSVAQTNARDARRKADIDAIAKALETNRAPGTVYYLALLQTYFSSGIVPLDNGDAVNKPHYCIKTSRSAAVPDSPTAWADNVACPTAATGWVDIGSWGLAVGPSTDPGGSATGTVKGTITGGSAFGYQIISWKVCARLEPGGFYCKPSSQ